MTDFDYVIVGGGSAGTVVASRLTEDSDTRVLLLEAGRNWRSTEADGDMRAANFLRLVDDGRFLWTDLEARLTEYQDPKPYLVGKGLGGGSTVNAQFWARPPLGDFDEWVAQGCTGWDGDTMQSYFNTVEADPDFGDRPYHGADGPMPVWRPREERDEWGPIDDAFREAATTLGHPTAPDRDLNAPGRRGICEGVYNRSDGKRVTTNDAYLEPVRDRDNLVVQGETLVDRVVFEGRSARGVEAIGPNGRETYASEGVILSAGAIFSPSILVRSGIGPRDDLESLDVPVRSERPGLGRLVDHPQLSIVFPLARDASVADTTRPSARVGTFWSSDVKPARETDLHVLTQNYRGVGDRALETGGLLFGLTDPFSQGRVTVSDTDPTTTPDVDVRLLDDPRDLNRVVEAVRHIQELLAQPAFRSVARDEPALVYEPGHTVALSTLETEAELERAILEAVDSYDHPAGTCRMGDPADPNAVVDPTGAVIGARDLYVVDASIMPDIVNVQPNYTVIAMAERLADLITA